MQIICKTGKWFLKRSILCLVYSDAFLGFGSVKLFISLCIVRQLFCTSSFISSALRPKNGPKNSKNLRDILKDLHYKNILYLWPIGSLWSESCKTSTKACRMDPLSWLFAAESGIEIARSRKAALLYSAVRVRVCTLRLAFPIRSTCLNVFRHPVYLDPFLIRLINLSISIVIVVKKQTKQKQLNINNPRLSRHVN